jgi:glycosyltransferase involved in cell wall biosynthesis
VRLVLIGDGDEEQRIRSKTAEMGLENSVIFLGSRPDIPRLLLGALDIFLFPSTSEGLGLALVEAQAAGLPCIVSANVPEEVAVVKPLVTRLPLDLPAQHWGKELIRIAARPPAVARSEALQRIEKSPFTIRSSMRCLEKVYTTARSL